MANATGQELIVSDDDWHRAFSSEPLPSNEVPADFVTDTLPASFEETIAVVKDRVWKFGDVALKGMAEVLVGFGISPSILGYATVPEQEGSEVVQRDEGEAALDRVARDPSLTNSSFAMRTKDSTHHRRSGEEGSLLNREEEDEDDNHAFAESIRRDTDERKSLTRSGSWEDGESDGDAEEDKKDK